MSPLFSVAGLLLSIARSAQANDTQHVYAEDQLTVVPVALRQPPTIYPDSLKRRSIGGTVGVSVVIDRKGYPDSGSVRVVSTPDSAFSGPARAVVLGTRFAPGRTRDGPVRALVVLRVEFDPSDSATAPPPIYGENESLGEKPAIVFGPRIDYPEDLRCNRIQGRVLVQAILDTLGRVEPGSIQFATTPDPGFLMPVSQYLALARFRPARRNGRPVRSCVTIPFDFRLRGGPGFPSFPCPPGAELRRSCRS